MAERWGRVDNREALPSREVLLRMVSSSRQFAEAVPDLSALLDTVARHLSEATGDACTVRLLSPDETTLVPVASHFADATTLAAMRSTMEVTQRADTGLWAAVVTKGEAVTYVLPAGSAPRAASPAQRAFIAEYQPRHIMGVPLRAREHLLGAVGLTRFRDEPFGADEMELIEALAERASIAIDNARLFRAAQAATAEAEARARQLERQVERIQALHTVDLAITGSLDLRVTLNVLLDQVVAHLQVDAAQVLLFEPGSGMLEFGAARGFRAASADPPRAPLGDDAASRAVAERRVVSTEHGAWSGSTRRRALFAREGFVRGRAVPLIARDSVIGVLEVFRRTAHAPDPDWSSFLEVLAGQAAIAIDGAATHGHLQRSHADLVRAYDTTLEGWVRALDLRDRQVEGHSQRVTAMAVHFARLLGFAETGLADVYRGALLHDVGKIAVPDEILRKKGPLTEEEWVVMRRHPDHADQWLAPIPFLRNALDIPREHHEKWDGSGYPRGLRGTEIAPAARMFAIVDVYDALRSVRPYGAARSAEEARAYVAGQAGAHFDPTYIATFLAVDWEPVVAAASRGAWPQPVSRPRSAPTTRPGREGRA
jgi:HD-GYP domain-containing protein (c-di-GMP phosphodiesterase class II)